MAARCQTTAYKHKNKEKSPTKLPNLVSENCGILIFLKLLVEYLLFTVLKYIRFYSFGMGYDFLYLPHKSSCPL